MLMNWRCDEHEELLLLQRPPAGQTEGAPRLPDSNGWNERAHADATGRTACVRRILHLRSDQWPKWACRRAPTKIGALVERWRAQCGSARLTIPQPANSRICRGKRRRG